MGADAAAAGFFDCPECLHEISTESQQENNALRKYNPQELQSGHFTTELGYFAKPDYEPYYQRACLEGESCEAHTKLGQPKKIGYSKFFDSGMKYDQHYGQIYDQNYLKQKYNEQREALKNTFPADLYLPKPA